MNLENFAEFLKYPSRLYQLPYEELKSLTMQYPYCANFHVLLLIKSKLERHPDLEKNLARAATYSVDRRHLRKLLQEETLLPVDSALQIGEDEVLELQDLLSLEDRLETVRIDQTNVGPRDAAPFAFDLQRQGTKSPEDLSETEWAPETHETGQHPETETPADFPRESFTDETKSIDESEESAIVPQEAKDHPGMGIPDAAGAGGQYRVPEALIRNISTAVGLTQRLKLGLPPAPPMAEPIRPASFSLRSTVVRDCAAVSALLQRYWERQDSDAVLEWDLSESVPAVVQPEKADLPTGIAPTPKSKFQSYRKRYGSPVSTRTPVRQTVASPPPPQDAREVAEQSLREDLGVASETLAGLLVEQHQYERAIKMYEHLSLLIPEKNTYFAAKIDAIKKL